MLPEQTQVTSPWDLEQAGSGYRATPDQTNETLSCSSDEDRVPMDCMHW